MWFETGWSNKQIGSTACFMLKNTVYDENKNYNPIHFNVRFELFEFERAS